MQKVSTTAATSDKWLRILYMLLFAVLYKVAELVMWAVAMFLIVMNLITGESNEPARRFGDQLAHYACEIWRYLTYNTESKPYPFSDWPSGESLD